MRPAAHEVGLDRREVLRGMLALGGGLLAGGCATGARTMPGGNARLSGGRTTVRWLGGGVMELATPDYKQIAYLDAWVWNNTGWKAFNVQKPPEYATPQGFVQYVAGKKPEAVLVLLTHDHGDHIGDYFEMLKALSDGGVPVMTAGQSDLMRAGLVARGAVPLLRASIGGFRPTTARASPLPERSDPSPTPRTRRGSHRCARARAGWV